MRYLAAGMRPSAQSTRTENPRRYVSLVYSDALVAAGVKASVGIVADSCDHALAETMNGLYKAELLFSKRTWGSVSGVELAAMDWVRWWNMDRFRGAVGYRTPASVGATCPHPTTTAPATVSPRNGTQGAPLLGGRK